MDKIQPWIQDETERSRATPRRNESTDSPIIGHAALRMPVVLGLVEAPPGPTDYFATLLT